MTNFVLPARSITRNRLLLKRAFDYSAAAILLVVLSPLMLAIALAIRLTSRGPAIYKQQRIGVRLERQNGRYLWTVTPFTMYKFRSMYLNAPHTNHEAFVKAFIRNDKAGMAEVNNGETALFKLKRDPRVTPVGALLRKTSLDELPQLINVLKGEMSLVGPRPALQYELEAYQPWHMDRLAAFPGITGYWQVAGRSAVEFDKMVEMDIWYVDHQSLWLDLRILLMTPLSVLKGKGAG